MRILTKGALLVAAAAFLIPGHWAFCFPLSFYETIANFPPFNLHLFHDLGAFQLAIGVVMLGALFWQDAMFLALFGGSVGMVVHAISHIVDRHLGGNPSDPWVLSLLALLAVAATILRGRVMYQTAAAGIGSDHFGAARKEHSEGKN